MTDFSAKKKKGERLEKFFIKNCVGDHFISRFDEVMDVEDRSELHVEGCDFSFRGKSRNPYIADEHEGAGEVKGIANFINRNNDGNEPSGTIPLEIFFKNSEWGWLYKITGAEGMHDYQTWKKSVQVDIGGKHLIPDELFLKRIDEPEKRKTYIPTELVYVLATDEDMHDPFAVVWFEWWQMNTLLYKVADEVLGGWKHFQPQKWNYSQRRKNWMKVGEKFKGAYTSAAADGGLAWHVPLERLIEAAHITVDVRDGQTDQDAEAAILCRVKAYLEERKRDGKKVYACDESIMRQRIRYLLDHAEKKIDFTGKNFDRTMLNRK